MKQSEIREALTLKVRFPYLFSLRVKIAVQIIRLAAIVAGVGVAIECQDKANGDGA